MSEFQKRHGWDQTSVKVGLRLRWRRPLAVLDGVVKKPLPVDWFACLGEKLFGGWPRDSGNPPRDAEAYGHGLIEPIRIFPFTAGLL